MHYLQKCDKIDNVDRVLVEYIKMSTKLQKVQKMHTSKITPPSEKDKRYQATYVDSNGKRKWVKAPTEEELWKKLIPVYLPESNLDKLIFHELYIEWMEYKKSMVNSLNTIQRHEQHYHKYFESSILHNMSIKRIDELSLEMECNRIVKDFSLTHKEWNNIKTILKGMFEYAVRKKYLSENPMEKVKIHVKFRQVVKKTGSTQTYNTEELQNLNQYLDVMYTETEDSVFMAVKVNFLLGLRVGELVSLKWSDVVNNTHLHIVREETRDQYTNTYHVVEHTKTHQDRFVVLVPKALEILNKIDHQGEYIFMRDGERIVSRQIAYVLEKYSERQGTGVKSTHKMRKTFASNLSANGVPVDCIRELLGHNNLSTTLGYIYNPLTESETYELIAKAL